MKETQRIRLEKNANACIQCKDSGGDDGGPMYKWSAEGKCEYKSLRACQVANGPPVVASHDDFEKMYRDLPLRYRDQWDPARFEQLAAAPMQSGGGSVFDARAFEKHKLPKPEENEFGGNASATNVMIEGWTPTLITNGSFKNTLANADERNRVKVLFQHSMPIGKPTFMEEDDTGLIVMGKVSQTELGKEVMQLVRDRVIDEMSIGWDPVEFSFREEGDDFIRIIHELRLWEFSAVTFGANPGAKISVTNMLRGINAQADAMLPQLEHALGIGACCDGCETGSECDSGPAPEQHEISTIGAITLLSTALDHLRNGRVSAEERQSLAPLVSMFSRVLELPATNAPITKSTEANVAPSSIDMDAAMRALDELDSLAHH